MKVLGAIIAGGKSTRMGQDKALLEWAGHTLIEHVAARLLQQVDQLVINANDDRFIALALLRETPRRGAKIEIIRDILTIDSPIAGLHAALTYAAQKGFDAVVSAPCDAPFLPEDLRQRLEGQGPAIACSAGQAHFLTGFWPVYSLPLIAGQRRMQDFAEVSKARRVEWTVVPFDPFTNLNTLEDVARLSEKP